MTSELSFSIEWNLLLAAALLFIGAIIVGQKKRSKNILLLVSTGAVLIALFYLVYIWILKNAWVFVAETSLKGWLLPKSELTALQIGMTLDPIGLGVLMLELFLLFIVGFSLPRFSTSKELAAQLGAICIAGAGAVLTCLSGTVWVWLMGLSILFLSQFVALLAASHQGETAEKTAHKKAVQWNLLKNLSALLLITIGALVLMSSGIVLNWGAPLVYKGGFDQAAGFLFVGAGVCLALGLFPFCFFEKRRDPISPELVLLEQGFTQLAVSIFLVRTLPQSGDGFLQGPEAPIFLTVFILTLISAHFQSTREQLFRGGAAALSGGVIFILFASGPAIGITGSILHLLYCAFWSYLSMTTTRQEPQNGDLSGAWLKILAWFVLLAVSGLIGTSGATPWSFTFQKLTHSWGLLAAFAFGLLLFQVLLVRQLNDWREQGSDKAGIPWYAVIFGLLLLLTIGPIWTGSFSSLRELFASDTFMNSFLGSELLPISTEALLVSQLIVLFVFGFGAFTRLFKLEMWTKISRDWPDMQRFLAEGFGVGRILKYLVVLGSGAGAKLFDWLDKKSWEVQAAHFLKRSIKKSGVYLGDHDDFMIVRGGKGLDLGVRVSGKLLQLVQNGSVQWYLIFASGAGVALLIHFSRQPG